MTQKLYLNRGHSGHSCHHGYSGLFANFGQRPHCGRHGQCVRFGSCGYFGHHCHFGQLSLRSLWSFLTLPSRLFRLTWLSLIIEVIVVIMVILFIASIVVIEVVIAIMAIVVNVVIVVIVVFTPRSPKWYLMSCYGGLRYADMSLVVDHRRLRSRETLLSDMKAICRRCLGNSGRAFNHHATSSENPDNEVPTRT